MDINSSRRPRHPFCESLPERQSTVCGRLPGGRICPTHQRVTDPPTGFVRVLIGDPAELGDQISCPSSRPINRLRDDKFDHVLHIQKLPPRPRSKTVIDVKPALDDSHRRTAVDDLYFSMMIDQQIARMDAAMRGTHASAPTVRHRRPVPAVGVVLLDWRHAIHVARDWQRPSCESRRDVGSARLPPPARPKTDDELWPPARTHPSTDRPADE